MTILRFKCRIFGHKMRKITHGYACEHCLYYRKSYNGRVWVRSDDGVTFGMVLSDLAKKPL